ncbi:Protein of unknown function [Pseudooceanicola nitratireducens]|jgi:hypothetical protein|uniref:VWFA domain-containing protein n=1 Tax=Pseudooceanicola nitratireducens TaxID=517719 RepID=A0A1I1NJT3_9RHOB|nr:DUF1194 domain-containing protein [Pseudooceanicola nitratireducens]SEI71302.1 Protein of unknown function [Pseudooceanicola nitratireducens]SFC95738.1 Protein of unknown function [Pseudooceanicola nitratireducens]
MAAWLRVTLVVVLLLPGVARAQCRQALLLALDVSGSVDAREYRLQLDGLAAALMDPAVVGAFQAMPGAPLRLAVMEWSGAGFQRVVLPWQEVQGRSDLAGIADHLRRVRRVPADPSTAIGSALLRGAQLLADQMGCWRRVMDVSGDGKANTGPLPQSVTLTPADIIVNGLVVGEPQDPHGRSPGIGELVAYFRAYVIRGDSAFVEAAQGFEDFEAAMIRKLLRELQVVAVSEVR